MQQIYDALSLPAFPLFHGSVASHGRRGEVFSRCSLVAAFPSQQHFHSCTRRSFSAPSKITHCHQHLWKTPLPGRHSYLFKIIGGVIRSKTTDRTQTQKRQVSDKMEEDKVIRVRCSGKLCGEGVLAGGRSIISACFTAFIDDQTVAIKQDCSL